MLRISTPTPRGRMLGAAAAALAVAALLAGPATATAPPVAPTAALGQPGTSQANPITEIGAPTLVVASVDIRWPEGTQEVVPLGMIPATTTAQQLTTLRTQAVTAREAAEARSPVNGVLTDPTVRTTAGHARRAESVGPYACGVAANYPWKAAPHNVATRALVQCTSNVEDVDGTIFLTWSAAHVLIGANYYVGGWLGTNFYTAGACAPSTWQYNASLDFTMNTVIGDFDFSDDWGPSWIAC